MLEKTPLSNLTEPSSPDRDRRLHHDNNVNMLSMGCLSCPEKDLCGGLKIRASMFNCLDFCCGNPNGCDKVCRNHPNFFKRYREINGFDLSNVPRGRTISPPSLPRVVPILFHGNRRETDFSSSSVVALSLFRMVDRRTGVLRFSSHEEICAAYKVAKNTPIILTGTADDRPLENWWGLEAEGRRKAIRGLKDMGIALATTPNYSLFLDSPRWDDLHAMKRIALTHHEFIEEGIPTALHVNGRTDHDFLRWTEFISSRPEITHIAYEFTTGTGWAGRREQHLSWLVDLAKGAGRPLNLVVRGGLDLLPHFRKSFQQVTLLESSIFMKTMKRQEALAKGNRSIQWKSVRTANGQPLDYLLSKNCNTVTEWVHNTLLPANEYDESDKSVGNV